MLFDKNIHFHKKAPLRYVTENTAKSENKYKNRLLQQAALRVTANEKNRKKQP